MNEIHPNEKSKVKLQLKKKHLAPNAQLSGAKETATHAESYKHCFEQFVTELADLNL